MEYSASLGWDKKLTARPLDGRAVLVRYEGMGGYTEWLVDGGVRVTGGWNGMKQNHPIPGAETGLREIWPILYNKLPSEIRDRLSGFPR